LSMIFPPVTQWSSMTWSSSTRSRQSDRQQSKSDSRPQTALDATAVNSATLSHVLAHSRSDMSSRHSPLHEAEEAKQIARLTATDFRCTCQLLALAKSQIRAAIPSSGEREISDGKNTGATACDRKDVRCEAWSHTRAHTHTHSNNHVTTLTGARTIPSSLFQ
jgi:hypothetical protein